MSTTTTVRRTLPAPIEPISIEAVVAERDRLRAEVTVLRLEVASLRDALAEKESEAALSRLEPVPSPSAPLYPPNAIPTGAVPELPAFGGAPSGGLDFGTVSRLSPSELDGLPYGLICLDAQGRVVHYNDTESRMARLPKERVLGKSFFGEVAPCTRVREFEGQFLELVRDPARVRVRTFDFVFRFRHGEQHVTIVMTPARTRGLYNLALLRRSVAPA